MYKDYKSNFYSILEIIVFTHEFIGNKLWLIFYDNEIYTSIY
jgi:hypothetical protein